VALLQLHSTVVASVVPGNFGLAATGRILRFRGTPVKKHCSRQESIFDSTRTVWAWDTKPVDSAFHNSW